MSNTNLCEASRLIQRRPDNSVRFTTVRLFDLFSVIEASVLYERIYTLPALLKETDEALGLRTVLIEAGIVHELNPLDSHAEIARYVINCLAAIQQPVKVAGGSDVIGKPIEFDSVRKEIAEFLVQTTNATLTSNELDTTIALLARSYQDRGWSPPSIFDTSGRDRVSVGRVTEVLDATSLDSFGRELIGWIEYSGSGAYEFCASVMRDMYYIATAEHFRLPYWPQSTRIQFARKFPNYFDADVRSQLHRKLATEMKQSVEEVSKAWGISLHAIPPFSAIVLDSSRSIEDIPNQILVLREKYAQFRERMAALDQTKAEAKSMHELLTLTMKQKQLIDLLGANLSKQDGIFAEKMIRFIPDLIRPAMSPLDPTKYGAALLLQPIEWIVDAIRQRPISMLLSAKSKVLKMKDYNSLVTKLFGVNLRERDWQELAEVIGVT
jgi:hypothetical protein